MFLNLKKFNKNDYSAYLKGLHNINENQMPMIIGLSSADWSVADYPKVVCSYLADAYNSLPMRPDLGLNLLWAAMNRSYNDLYFCKKGRSGAKSFTDSDAIDLFLSELKSLRNEYIKDGKDVGYLLSNTYSSITLKNINFISQIILKGAAEEKQSISELYRNKTYSKIKKTRLGEKALEFYGDSYSKNCTTKIASNGMGVEYNFKEENKSRKAVFSLSTQIRDLVMGKKTKFSFNGKEHELQLNNEEIDEFIFRHILYANRNNTLHARSSPRLTSEHFTHDYFKSEMYLFYLAHCFLSISLVMLGHLKVSDLEVNFQNLDILNKVLNNPIPGAANV